MKRTMFRRRLVAGAAAVALVATLALFVGHHHPDEGDSSACGNHPATCLICRAVFTPAVQSVVSALPAIPFVSASFPFCEDDLRIAAGWPGARTARSPPFC